MSTSRNTKVGGTLAVGSPLKIKRSKSARLREGPNLPREAINAYRPSVSDSEAISELDTHLNH